jgi:hypothetical protein
MPIQHKFLNYNEWNNGFYTENSILKNKEYLPEVLFIGTFNPMTPNDNHADFFYGRNWFWPAFKNLFIENAYILVNRRMPSNGVPNYPLNPTIEDIFDICKKAKISFADMINGVFPETNDYDLLNNDNVIYNNVEYNLIQDDALARLNQINQIDWNIENISNYLCENPQIKNVYFTRRPIGIWLRKWNELKKSNCSRNIEFGKIYTPSATNLRGEPRMEKLIQHWLFNENNNYESLNHEWLIRNGVNPNHF